MVLSDCHKQDWTMLLEIVKDILRFAEASCIYDLYHDHHYLSLFEKWTATLPLSEEFYMALVCLQTRQEINSTKTLIWRVLFSITFSFYERCSWSGIMR